MELGPMINDSFVHDPRRLAFTFSRYKFVAKMLEGVERVCEIGCGDGFASAIVAQTTKKLILTDFDPLFIREAIKVTKIRKNIEVTKHNFVEESLPEKFDAIYALDVLEHIKKTEEIQFLRNIVNSLSRSGICIIGMPSIESQEHASDISIAGHVNCKSGIELKSFMSNFFKNTFLFSMNDEVVHTGFSPMAQYVIVLAVTPKS
jgi:2-polyprenyl-3-methyl-5-hydroxy-6-metoxy-1,4-benzoquinol methylase